MNMESTEINHGTQTAYAKHRCRCERCRAWQAAKQRRYREGKRIREGRPPVVVKVKESTPVGHMVRVADLDKPVRGEWEPMDTGRVLAAADYPEFAEFIEAEYGTVGRWVDVPQRRSARASKRWFIRVR